MKKNYFNQLRYVIPVLILPFSAIIIAGTSGKNAPLQAEKSNSNEMNAELQAPDLEKTQTMNKFDALFSAYDKTEDFSAIKGIEEEDKNLELDNKDLYSMSEMDKINEFNKKNGLDGRKEKSVSNFDLYKGSEVSNGYPNVPKANSYTSKSGYNSTASRDFDNYTRAINTASNPPEAQPKSR